MVWDAGKDNVKRETETRVCFHKPGNTEDYREPTKMRRRRILHLSLSTL